MTGEQLIDEVQALIGRPDDTELITDARVTRWLNEAQQDIVEKCPGLLALEFDNTSLVCVSDQVAYNISDITCGDDTASNYVAHLLDVFFLDGDNSFRIPYTHIDEFDGFFPDITTRSPDKPTRWTRAGNQIKVSPRPSTDYVDYILKVKGTAYAEDFTTNDSDASDISMADNGLIYYAVGEAWASIGNEDRSLIYKQKYQSWLDDYIDKNDNIHSWDGNLYSDGIY